MKVHVFSYGGRGSAADVGAVLSTLTNVSEWVVAMSTTRGLFTKVSVPYVIVTSVRLSVAVLDWR